ncbi:hypothetical protein V8E36_003724 [Tilletia maclaganii]
MNSAASRSRVQGLIMEVLNAHPSARDSKTYLQSFGIALPPHQNGNQQQQQQQQHPPSPIPVGGSTSAASHFMQHTALVKVQGPFSDRQLSSIADGLVYLKRLGLMSVLVIDSERWPTAAARFNQQGQLLVPRALIDPDSDALHSSGAMAAAAFSNGSRATTRTPAALVGKAQEGLRKRMIHQVLRLSSLLEARGAQSLPLTQPMFRIDPNLVPEMHARVPFPAPWRQHVPENLASLVSAAEQGSHRHASSSSHGSAPPPPPRDARSPFLSSSRSPNEYSVYQSPLSGRVPLVSSDALAAIRAALLSDQLPVLAPIALYEDPHDHGAERALAVSTDDALVGLAREMSNAAIEAAEKRKHYLSAKVAPDARKGDREEGKEGDDDHDEEAAAEAAAAAAAAEEADGQDDLDLMPLRLMVINREGGIPSHARGGNPHLSINLISEYTHVHRTFIWGRSHSSALRNLRTVKDCLAYMPHPTSSGVVVSHRSPKSLIANLITNKAAHSPSLPHRMLEGRNDVRHTPTIVRWGLPVQVLERFEDVDTEKLAGLLEISFGRKLDRVNYFERLKRRLDFVIVAGDYQGAAIVTKEWAPGEEEEARRRAEVDASTAKVGSGSVPVTEIDAQATADLVDAVEAAEDGTTASTPLEPIAYLDKFAVLPDLRGSGVVDFLWGALRDEVHGLGLLDALNANGGKGGFGVGRDLVWKSRGENTVNRWYFERSNGFVRIPGGTPPPAPTGTGSPESDHDRLPWVMFWCDAEERLANMSGEKRLGAEATYEDVLDTAVERERRRQEDEEEEALERRHGDSEARMRRMWGEDLDLGGVFGSGADDTASAHRARAGRAASVGSGRSSGSSSNLGTSPSPTSFSRSSLSPMTSAASDFVVDTDDALNSFASSGTPHGGRRSIDDLFSLSSPASTVSAAAATEQAASSSAAAAAASASSSSGGNLFTRLPFIAPEERGRLDRWARCMAGIPSAWL